MVKCPNYEIPKVSEEHDVKYPIPASIEFLWNILAENIVGLRRDLIIVVGEVIVMPGVEKP